MLLMPILVFTGCKDYSDSSCTQIGCGYDGGAYFAFRDRFDDWESEQAADYSFTLTWEGDQAICHGVISEGVSCDNPLADVRRITVGMEPDAYNGLDAITLSVFPGATHLTVERDGSVVFDGDFDVVEQVTYPNGEQCDPECRSWSESISW